MRGPRGRRRGGRAAEGAGAQERGLCERAARGGGGDGDGAAEEEDEGEGGRGGGGGAWDHHQSRQDRLRGIQEALKSRKIYKEGRLVHRTESDMKTHTSYLVFAVLPREWSEEDEAAAEARMADGGESKESEDGRRWEMFRRCH